eukprot:ANDGO_08113.mRNA.1 Kinesin-like protein KIN-5C
MASCRVRVVAKLRPLLPQEGTKTCLSTSPDYESGKQLIHLNALSQTLSFSLDSVYEQETNLSQFYSSEIKPMVLNAVKNSTACSVFAYGVTGSGKTHTMHGSASEAGVIPRAVHDVFANLKPKQRVLVSYLEIYQEKVYDLLVEQNVAIVSSSSIVVGMSEKERDKRPELPLRDDGSGNVVVADLTHKSLQFKEEFAMLFEKAQKFRKVAGTKCNAQSSRSHAVLELQVVPSGGKVVLVDLAGCEDNRKTGNVGIRLAESSAINISLFTLGKVIHSLQEPEKTMRIPYRDSKLTRLLQDSLGGTAQTLMIATLSPSPLYCQGTLHVLQYAAKTRSIENHIQQVQNNMSGRLLEERKEKTREEELRQWREKHGGGKSSAAAGPSNTGVSLAGSLKRPLQESNSAVVASSAPASKMAKTALGAPKQSVSSKEKDLLFSPRVAKVAKAAGVDAGRFETLERKVDSLMMAIGCKSMPKSVMDKAKELAEMVKREQSIEEQVRQLLMGARTAKDAQKYRRAFDLYRKASELCPGMDKIKAKMSRCLELAQEQEEKQLEMEDALYEPKEDENDVSFRIADDAQIVAEDDDGEDDDETNLLDKKRKTKTKKRSQGTKKRNSSLSSDGSGRSSDCSMHNESAENEKLDLPRISYAEMSEDQIASAELSFLEALKSAENEKELRKFKGIAKVRAERIMLHREKFVSVRQDFAAYGIMSGKQLQTFLEETLPQFCPAASSILANTM